MVHAAVGGVALLRSDFCDGMRRTATGRGGSARDEYDAGTRTSTDAGAEQPTGWDACCCESEAA